MAAQFSAHTALRLKYIKQSQCMYVRNMRDTTLSRSVTRLWVRQEWFTGGQIFPLSTGTAFTPTVMAQAGSHGAGDGTVRV